MSRFESNYVKRDTSDEVAGVRDKSRSELIRDDFAYAAGSENAARRHAGERDYAATLGAEQQAEKRKKLTTELSEVEQGIQSTTANIERIVGHIQIIAKSTTKTEGAATSQTSLAEELQKTKLNLLAEKKTFEARKSEIEKSLTELGE